MNIIYMGTPEFAVPPLEKLIQKKHCIQLVITQPDKAKDRGKKVQFSPVKQKAIDHGIEIMQPERIKGNLELIKKMESFKPDCIVVAAYGKILPLELLAIPRFGCINIHASLLPKYRGAAPIQWSIINGDEFTGICIMSMSEGLDTGDILAVSMTTTAKKTSTMLHEELALMGADLLIKTLDEIESGQIVRTKQNNDEATYAPLISKQTGFVDFHKSPSEIERLIRGLNPWPSAFTEYQGETVKLWEAEDLNQSNEKVPGTILRLSKSGIEVSAGGGTLLIQKIQFPGKKPMLVKDYLLGHTLEVGAILGHKDTCH